MQAWPSMRSPRDPPHTAYRSACRPSGAARTLRSTGRGGLGVDVQCPGCNSSNVEHLPHYWQSLPAESPLRAKYAPPPESEARFLPVLGLVILGIVAITSGAIVPGLLAVLAGLVWGAIVQRGVSAAQAALAEWSAARICLACTGRF